MVKNPPASAGDTGDLGSIPGPGRSPGGGKGNPLQCSCLGSPMDRGAQWAAVRGVTQRWTRLSTAQHGGEMRQVSRPLTWSPTFKQRAALSAAHVHSGKTWLIGGDELFLFLLT